MDSLTERVKKIVFEYMSEPSTDAPLTPIKCTKDELDLVWQQRREIIPLDLSSYMSIESKDLIKSLLIRMTSVSDEVMVTYDDNAYDDDDECILIKCICRRSGNSKLCSKHREVSIAKKCFNFSHY